MNELNTFFKPNSVAILGASRDEKKIGNIVLQNIINSRFKGRIFPINPNSQNILGLTCYPDFAALPQTPDLAIISLPATVAMSLLESIAKKGTKNIVIFSAGFKEAGLEGEKMERELSVTANRLGLTILGPNCLGFASTISSLNATFSLAGNTPGNLRFISQSGALASAIFDWGKQNEIGFSEFITLGNKAVLNENNILEYWLSDKTEKIKQVGLSDYQPVGMYLESVEVGKEFLELAKKVSKENPIFILKPGKSQHAQKAILSHTGSMAGDDSVQDTVFAEAGIIRCEGIEDMFDLSKIFSWENAPKGPRVAIVSNAGGPAVISTDALEAHGLQLAKLGAKTLEKLKNSLPRAASVINPVDVLGDALSDRYHEAIEDVLAEGGVDALVVLLTPQIMTEIKATAELIGTLSAKYNKPIVCSFMGGAMVDVGERVLNAYKIPSFRFPERAIKALAHMWHWQEQRKKIKTQKTAVAVKNNIKKIEQIIASLEPGNKVLSLKQGEELLKLFGIKTPKSEVVQSFAQAKIFAQKNHWPVVLKLSSPDLIHKTDGGAVLVNIQTDEELEKAWQKITAIAKKLPKKFSYSIQVQQQVEKGTEVIAGIRYDHSFGNVLLFGAGGILAELVGDRNLKMLPLDEEDAKNIIAKSRVSKLLNGFRGHKPYAIKKLATLLVQLSAAAQATSYFSEITINPIIVTATEAWAVDPRIILK